ncbi:MAG: metallophosphoesterase family protein [Desulfatibacillaceae bacterium]
MILDGMTRRECMGLLFKGAVAAGTWPRVAPVLAAIQKTNIRDLLPPEKIVTLPASGTLYVANDFHANHTDFKAFFKKTRAFERIREGADVRVVLNGDLVDYKAGHSEAEGDARIMDDLLRMRAELAETGRADRLVVLAGNHEEAVLSLYDTLVHKRDFVMPRADFNFYIRHQDFTRRLQFEKDNRKALSKSNGLSLLGYVSQFNYIDRITRQAADYLRDLPYLAVCANGIIITHASYPRIDSTNRVFDTLWERRGSGSNFLHSVDGELLVNGHTAPHLFGSKLEGQYDPVRGVGTVARDRVIIAPSHGARDTGTFLAVDLSKRYVTQRDLGLGVELIPLR